MAKVFQMAFELAGRLDSSFRSSFQGANDAMSRTRQEIRDLRKAQRTLDESFRQGAVNQKSYSVVSAQYAEQMHGLKNSQSRMAAANNMKNEAEAGKEKYANLTLSGAAMAAPFVLATKTAMDFEAKMSKVKAITNANEADFLKLNQTARQLGATTQFSATQAAEAMSFLGMAGWKTNDVIAGMPGLLSLAAAGGTDLARTADIISDDLTAFGLAADQAGHMADVFAVTITSTNTNVEMLGETMKYAAPVAKAFGASLEETSTLAGLMANSGIKASQAGTALRAGFLRLAGPPKMAAKELEAMGMSLENINNEQREAAAAMAGLGISMDDLSGKPKKMSAILRELKDRTADMGREQKLAALKAIFGTEAATGWLAVLDQGPDTFDALVQKLEQSDGAANKMAKTMTDNAKGAMIQLSSAIESVSIAFGSIFLPQIAQGAKKVAEFTTKVTEWAEANPEIAKTATTAAISVAGLTTGVGILGYAMNFVKGGIAGAIGPLISLHKEIFVAKDAMTGLSKAQKAAKLAQVSWTEALKAGKAVLNGTAFAQLATAVRSVGAASKAAAIAQGIFNASLYGCPLVWIVGGIAAVVAAGYLLYENWDTITTFLGSAWESATTYISEGWNSLTSEVEAGMDAVGNYLSEGYDQAADFVSSLPSIAANALSTLWGYWTDGVQAVSNFFLVTLPQKAAYGIGYAIGFLSTLPKKTKDFFVRTYEAASTWLGNLLTNAKTYLSQLPGRMIAAGAAFLAAAKTWGQETYAAAVSWIQTTVEAAGTWLYELPGRMMAAGAAFLVSIETWGRETWAAAVSWIQTTVEAAGTWLMELPQKSMEAGAAFIASAEQWAEGAYQCVLQWISQIPGMVKDKIAGAGAALSGWWDGMKEKFSAGFSAGAGESGDIGGHAEGGIFTRPHIAWFAEGKSAEAAIPINRNPRSISLLERTNKLMGNPLGVGAGSSINAVFSPTVHISGNADETIMQRLMAELKQQKEEFMQQIQALNGAGRQAERLSF